MRNLADETWLFWHCVECIRVGADPAEVEDAWDDLDLILFHTRSEALRRRIAEMQEARCESQASTQAGPGH